jgi:hypothetical protein
MLIILFLSLTITNILKYGRGIRHEGFENSEEIDHENDAQNETDIHLSKDDEDDETKKEKKIKNDKYKKNKMKNKNTEIKINPAEIAEKMKKIVDILKS